MTENNFKELVRLAVLEALEDWGPRHLVTKAEYERDRGQIRLGLALCMVVAGISLGAKVFPVLMKSLF